jgi:putative RNA 2'-phosphotransferase
MKDRSVKISKFLSLVLRHKPETIGLRLDEAGWVNVADLLAALDAHGRPVTRAELEATVADNDKKRFAFDEDGTRLRASQGHSVEVELDYAPAVPPAVLYHGTVEKFLPSIRQQGLLKGRRHHVHLSADVATAQKVGARRGRPVILSVKAAAMQTDGHVFYLSANGVWLTDAVPPAYLELPA